MASCAIPSLRYLKLYGPGPAGCVTRVQPGEQARLAVALGGTAFAGRPMIFTQLEQGRLLGAAAAPGRGAARPDRARDSGGLQSQWCGAGAWRPSGGRGRLCGGPLLLDLLRLQVVQIIGGALRVTGRGEDEALVVLQHVKP